MKGCATLPGGNSHEKAAPKSDKRCRRGKGKKRLAQRRGKRDRVPEPRHIFMLYTRNIWAVRFAINKCNSEFLDGGIVMLVYFFRGGVACFWY